MKKYCVYTRVSTRRQGQSGLGLAAQLSMANNYIKTHGGKIEINFTETESGKNNKRPELSKAIKYCKQNKAVLLIAKLDRLSRNLHFITGLMEAGVDFVAADNPHANKLMIHMLAAFAEYEREMIAQRTRLALIAAKKRGVKLGTYGKILAKQNKNHADKFALDLAPDIQDIKSQGITAVRGICDALNARGIKTYRGLEFYPQTVQRLLRRIDALQQSHTKILVA